MHYDKILNLFDTENLSLQGCLSLIERRLENIILFTTSMEGSITSLFYYEKWGNHILDESEISICLTGFGERAFPTMIETNTVHMSTHDKHLVRSWEQFMSVNSEKDLINLKPSTEKKVKIFALLLQFFMRI